MKKTLAASLIAVFFLLMPIKETLAFTEPFIGEVRMFGGNFAPRGHAFCEGQLLPISSNTALFSLLGTTYGGDGRTTFALPDLRELEKSLKGVRYIIALEGLYPSRN